MDKKILIAMMLLAGFFLQAAEMISTENLNIRDPFIITDRENNRYLLYKSNGHGVDVYISQDLKTWQDRKTVFTPDEKIAKYHDFWAPEVHEYQGKYYLFITLSPKGGCRGTWCFRSDSPMGPFLRFSEKPLTPEDWFALDGTLWVDRDGKPYMVFCHEWVQITTGTICAVPLADDLSKTIGEPFLLFSSEEAPWSVPSKKRKSRVTDGPWLHRMQDGSLIMLWSTFDAKGYVTGIARSSDGTLRGTWTQVPKTLFDRNGGHPMIFRTLTGTPTVLLHSPNSPGGKERLTMIPVQEKDGILVPTDTVKN